MKNIIEMANDLIDRPGSTPEKFKLVKSKLLVKINNFIDENFDIAKEYINFLQKIVECERNDIVNKMNSISYFKELKEMK